MITQPDRQSFFVHDGVIILAFDEGPCEPDWPIDWPNFEFIERNPREGDAMIQTGDAQTKVEVEWD